MKDDVPEELREAEWVQVDLPLDLPEEKKGNLFWFIFIGAVCVLICGGLWLAAQHLVN